MPFLKMADLEQIYYNNRPFTLQFVESKIGLLLNETKVDPIMMTGFHRASKCLPSPSV